MARVDTLPHFLTDVADAIREKKGTEASIQASSFDTEIESIPTGANLNDYFSTQIPANTNSSTIAFNYLVKKLPPISIGEGVSNLQYCFRNCMGLTSLDLSNFDTSHITNMRNMFDTCNHITELDLSSFTTSSVTRMDYMFSQCTSLAKIDMRNFDFSNVTNYTLMFGDTASNGVPDNCEIIVADSTAKTWITDKFSRLTNVKTVAEYEGN